jgi:hypothetical protein
MRFSLLLFALYCMIKFGSKWNTRFKMYIKSTDVRVLIRTADGKRARLFIFQKGKVSSTTGNVKDFDVALIWKDAGTGFSVMTDKRKDASFKAAAEGKLRVEGMSVYAQWFEDGMNLIM